MALNNQDRQLLEAYHAGELSAVEETTLRNRLEAETEFREEVEQWEQIWIVGTQPTRAERENAAQQKDFLRDLEKGLPPVLSTQLKGRNRWWLWALLGVVVLLILWWFPPVREDGATPRQEVVPEQETITAPQFQAFNTTYFDHLRREGENLGGGTLTDAYAEYDAQNYATAWPLLLSQVEETQDSLLLLYAGVAALGAGEPQQAVEFLESLQTSPDAAYFVEEIRWYLALAYLENGARENATILLQQIVTEGRFQREEAQKVLEKIK